MKVKVTAKSWLLDNYKGRISIKVETDVLFTPENKTPLMERICRLIELEIENHELIKGKSR